MKIALTGLYPPPLGGVSSSVKQLAFHLRQDGYRVRIFVDVKEAANKVQDVYWYSLKSINPKRNLFFKIKEYQPDLIHCHSSNWRINIALVARFLSLPLIHHIYGERFPRQFQELSWEKRLLAKWSLRQARHIIAASSQLACFVKTLGIRPERIHYIPCLLPLETLPSSPVLPPRIRSLLQNREKILLLSTGFYQPHYGFSLIPEAAARLKERKIDFVWLVVGKGSREKVNLFQQSVDRYQVGDRVIPVGELDRAAMITLLSKVHVYVRTKYSDSFGIVIAEAHQLGCYCLFGDNNPYFLTDRDRLFSYQTGDTDSLTELLFHVLTQIKPGSLPEPQSRFREEARGNYERIKRIYHSVST